MYQVNLLPWRERALRRRGMFWLRLLVLQLMVALIIPALMLGGLRYQQQQLRDTLQGRERQHDELAQRYRQTQAALAQWVRLTTQDALRRRNQTHNQRYPRLLRQLAEALPQPLWLVALEEQRQRVTLRGLSPHYPAIVELTRNLTAQGVLPGHRLAEVNQRQDGLLTFVLTAPWGEDE
ncbi:MULTISPECIES: PilN domain-containing protein [Gammaproteobacteria]|uniref:PilN domain-containing protein n=1 Tax=Gammaproteobacteria TaxID=1236 RepID=UPI0021652AAE|nr:MULTISPECIES: PilN domain-containing protein [Gammaproteobacteria]MCS3406251.1 PilN domain-containing protein [Serratia sp. AKBS12]MDH4429543.1 PilN domain-containing protein [Pseudomonas shirazica]